MKDTTRSKARIVDPDKYYGRVHQPKSGIMVYDLNSYKGPTLEDCKIKESKPDGGPAEYYDFPKDYNTLNDVIEWKGDSSWKGDSFHLGNIVKAAWRWGIKSGTSKEYDARKFMYSGARLLMKYAGKDKLRETLQKMLDDKQFGGDK